MSHGEVVSIDIAEVMECERLTPLKSARKILIGMIVAGALALTFGIINYPPEVIWGAYLTNVMYWTGLSVGSVVITAIFQVVRATWAAPVRRVAEANVAFLPWAYGLILLTYFGREYLYPWGRAPMPGREEWMQPEFVYVRFAILLAILFYAMWRFVHLSLRSDIGFLREHARNKTRWMTWEYDGLVRNWKGSEVEIPELQNKISWNAPLIIALYAVIYSLFSFEMVMSMDVIWYSNMFGGFIFISNIYIAWVFLHLLTTYLSSRFPLFGKNIKVQQRWDIGKLTFGFCMLWGYLFLSQFLPQWYGNMPEETQWMILRTREYPWKAWGWVTFSMAFVIPFLILLSEDVKKVRSTLAAVGVIILIGVWLERYMVIMPALSPDVVPFGTVEVGLFFGFFGIWGLAVLRFMSRYPFLPVSSPLSRGITKW